MTHGWNTTKTEAGFEWNVTRTVWDAEANRAVSTVLKSGVCGTRAQAAGASKRWVLFFRRGGSI